MDYKKYRAKNVRRYKKQVQIVNKHFENLGKFVEEMSLVTEEAVSVDTPYGLITLEVKPRAFAFTTTYTNKWKLKSKAKKRA